jgi:hypothetical protein
MDRLELNTLQFSVEAAVALLGAARAHRLLGNQQTAADAVQRASRVRAKVERRLGEIQAASDHADWLLERLLDLKQKLREAGALDGEPPRDGVALDP